MEDICKIMRNEKDQCYILHSAGMEKKGLSFHGVYMKSGRKVWPEKGKMNS